MRIFIGEVSCGVAAGASKVRSAIESLMNDNESFTLGSTGCIGMCFLEPIVDLYDDDKNLIKRIESADGAKIALLNKSDLGTRKNEDILSKAFDKVLTSSLKYGDTGAVMALSDAVSSLFVSDKISVGNEPIVSSARHSAALTRALSFTDAAICAYSAGVYTDAAASEVEGALSAIAEIDGRAVSEEVVSDIFSKFCVGK